MYYFFHLRCTLCLESHSGISKYFIVVLLLLLRRIRESFQGVLIDLAVLTFVAVKENFRTALYEKVVGSATRKH